MRTPMSRHPVSRWVQIVAGVLLVIAAPIIGALPGPGGIFIFAGGMVLLLRNSAMVRRRWARAKRRWPKLGEIADITMRRASARRRRALRTERPR
jgi:hypothetical protein